MTTDEAHLVSAVSMLKALGVEEESDIEVDTPPGPRDEEEIPQEEQRNSQ